MDTLCTKFLHGLPKKIKDDPKRLPQALFEHFLSRTYYLGPNKGYYFEASWGNYVALSEKALEREVRRRGLLHESKKTTKRPSKNAPRELTKTERKEAERAIARGKVDGLLSAVIEKHSIKWAGRLIGYAPGLHRDVNGDQFLVTREIKIPAARQGDYSFHEKFTRELAPGIQADIIKTWTRYAFEALEAGPPFVPFQALILAGGAEYGKTLYAEEVLGGLFGGFVDATKHFVNNEMRFNEDVVCKGVSLIDDQDFPAKGNAQVFRDHLRHNTATTSRRVEAKFGGIIHVPVFQLTVLTSNTEEHNFNWFPEISKDIAGKIHLLKVEKAELLTGRGHEAKIRKELERSRSAWRWHLKHEYVPPAEILVEGRYGIKAFHHPELVSATSAARQVHETLEIVNQYTQETATKGEFYGTAHAFRQALLDSGIISLVKWAERNPYPSTIGKWLTAAAELAPDQIFVVADDAHAHRNFYRLLSPEKAEAVKKGAAMPEAKARIVEAKIPNLAAAQNQPNEFTRNA